MSNPSLTPSGCVLDFLWHLDGIPLLGVLLLWTLGPALITAGALAVRGRRVLWWGWQLALVCGFVVGVGLELISQDAEGVLAGPFVIIILVAACSRPRAGSDDSV